jgi:hypothetical protein
MTRVLILIIPGCSETAGIVWLHLLYFSILLHCVIWLRGFVCCLGAATVYCPFIGNYYYCSLTTCFGLTGHLQVCNSGKATAVRCNAVFYCIGLRLVLGCMWFICNVWCVVLELLVYLYQRLMYIWCYSFVCGCPACSHRGVSLHFCCSAILAYGIGCVRDVSTMGGDLWDVSSSIGERTT